jgi:YesN/AraC family two-component response regulator
MGISEEKLPHIFDRFYQADDSSVRNAEGTGIGLALTQELVKLLGGEISVKSILGAGSEFTVKFPVTRNTPVEHQDYSELKIPHSIDISPIPKSESTAQTKDLPQILIIEDNSDVLQYICSILQEEYQITTAQDGQHGLEKALEFTPDLIISDVMMPRMDGYQVCHALKLDTRTSHIPVILLTAKADIESKMEGLQYGADVYLTKPFLKEEILIRIQSILAQRRRLQSYYQQLYGIKDPNAGEDAVLLASRSENQFIQKVRSSIEDHLDDASFGVDQLCQDMAMSNSQLYRKLKAQTGLSAQELIQSIRLAHAKTLLKQTENTISEIAYDCGFSDPEYFSRVFKKETGSSPSEYRHSIISTKV